MKIVEGSIWRSKISWDVYRIVKVGKTTIDLVRVNSDDTIYTAGRESFLENYYYVGESK